MTNRLALTICTTLLFATSAFAQEWTIEALGDWIPRAVSINEDGSILGGWGSTSSRTLVWLWVENLDGLEVDLPPDYNGLGVGEGR